MTTPYPTGWGPFAARSGKALARATLALVVVGAVLVVGLVLMTLPLSGFGAWALRVLAVVLAVPVVLLAWYRHDLLRIAEETERTGSDPADVVTTRTEDGRTVEIIVQTQRGSLDPTPTLSRDLRRTTGWAFATLLSAGLAFGLVLVLAVAQAVG